MDPDPQPYIPSWHNVKIFLLGAVWAAFGALGPAVLEIGDAYLKNEMIEWDHIERMGVVLAGAALVAYWRKYRALVSPPPVKAA